MNWILGCGLLLSAVVTGFAMFELRHARLTYESLHELLVRDRDAAREEVVTLRRALFPQLERATSSPVSNARPAKEAVAASTSMPARLPWRVNFKRQVAAHNTKQLGIERTRQAIEQSQKGTA